jgi:hypothetical protein
MNSIALYVEGGGDSAQQKAELRQGLDALLKSQKQAAQNKRLGWKTIPCGGREQAFDAFCHALQTTGGDTLVILLVDAEAPVDPESQHDEMRNAQVRVRHLRQRDGWNLSNIDPKRIHLMVQCMEAWLVADPESLSAFYGKGFQLRRIPSRLNLEDEPKQDLQNKLKIATRKTQKGEYHKIKHASKLLQLIDPVKVEKRCPRFSTFIGWLSQSIREA